MFDPSKMDLDLNNLDKKESVENSKLFEENNTLFEKEKISDKKTDIFNNEKNTNNKTTEEAINIKTDILDDKKDIENESSSYKDDGKSEINTQNDENKEVEERIIFDINIDSIEYLIKYIISKQYDFFTLEPTDDKVKVSFKKDNIEKEVKYIKFPTYSNILLKSKLLTKLKVEDTTNSQEGKTEITINKTIFKVISKTVPSNTGEKLFFKLVKTEKKQVKKKKEKMSFGKMMGIFAGLLFTAFVLGGVFFTIILFNSESVADLQFLNNLGINTNAIKEFAAKLVNFIFGFIVLIEVILLFIFSYKALLTKKEFKKKKVAKIMITIFFLILTTITIFVWMFLAKKINALRGENYGKIEFYDNSKYSSELFGEDNSRIDIDEKIIGPITIRFNNTEFIQKFIDEGFSPKKVIWKIGSEQIEKQIGDPELIYKFNNKGLTNVSITLEGENIKGEKGSRESNIGNINLNNIVNIEEIKLDNGGTKFIFDATDLKHLGKIKWYYIPSLKGKTTNESNTIISKALSKEKLIGYTFNSKIIFEDEEYYGFKIVSGGEEKEELDKIFIVSKGDTSKIRGEIESNQDIDDEKKYSFIFKEPENDIGEAFIIKYYWILQDFDDNGEEKFINLEKDANLSDLEYSSKVNYIFNKSGEHKIKLVVIDSNNKEHIFEELIDISKKLSLSTRLIFTVENKDLEYKKNINYEVKNNTYYIEDIPSPSNLEVKADKIKSINQKYGLLNVYWDLDNDGNYEKTGKNVIFPVNKEGMDSFKVKYNFVNRNLETDIISVIETVHITAINKEAILDLKIIKDNSYVPIIVLFDASSSRVGGGDIDKFIFDYGDGTPAEERDGMNAGHKYIEEGDYTIKLTVVTVEGKRYSLEKKLILKNKPQSTEITASLKTAPTYQAIDFSAEDSVGEVANYFWDFGDGDTSTEISPSHYYKKEGTYTIKLIVEYTNKNIKNDEIKIKIYKD